MKPSNPGIIQALFLILTSYFIQSRINEYQKVRYMNKDPSKKLSEVATLNCSTTVLANKIIGNSKEKWLRFSHVNSKFILLEKKDVQFLEETANKRETSRLQFNRFLDERC